MRQRQSLLLAVAIAYKGSMPEIQSPRKLTWCIEQLKYNN